MATVKDQLYQKIEHFEDFEAREILDFVEYLEQKRTKEITEALNNAPEEDEELSEEELQGIKDAEEDIQNKRTLSYKEVFGEDE